jgi:hypothetical protein
MPRRIKTTNLLGPFRVIHNEVKGWEAPRREGKEDQKSYQTNNDLDCDSNTKSYCAF